MISSHILVSTGSRSNSIAITLPSNDFAAVRNVSSVTLTSAIGCSSSKVITSLIDEFQGPITGTSANLSGEPSCISGDEVQLQLGERLPLILDAGKLGDALASTIVVLKDDTWKIVREGVIPNSDIAAALT